MALPSSGAISLAQVQAEYGGADPISMSEYYRNGAYVPNSIAVNEGPVYARNTTNGSTGNYFWERGKFANAAYAFWNASYDSKAGFTPIAASGGRDVTSITSGGVTYTRGALVQTTAIADFYQVSRSYVLAVNQNVPTSGTISMSNFYGGRKT